MSDLEQLFERNRRWAQGVAAADAGFFTKLAQGQRPGYLWIGCADSRVPPSQIAGVGPGGLFVHRNIANLVVASDLSCQAVLDYAVGHLKVAHIVVCGHYGCGGLHAALRGPTCGPVGQWLQPAIELIARHRDVLDRLTDETQRWRKLCELNVIEQVANVCRSEPVQRAWQHTGTPGLTVHGLIYELADGLLKDMDIRIADPHDVESACACALAAWD